MKDWRFEPDHARAPFGSIRNASNSEIAGRVFREDAERILALRDSHTELIAELEAAADQCDRWAKQSQSGGWSTHQVEANTKLADRLRRVAANAKGRQ